MRSIRWLPVGWDIVRSSRRSGRKAERPPFRQEKRNGSSSPERRLTDGVIDGAGAYRDELLSHPTVADVRGWGLMMVLEIVADKQTMTFFDKSVDAQTRFQSIALKHGLAMYSSLYGTRRQPGLARGLPIWISPPLSINSDEVAEMMRRLLAMLSEWEGAVL